MKSITIPTTITPVTPEESGRLLEGIWRARVYVNSCPYRRLLGLNWKRYYKERAREMAKDNQKVLVLISKPRR